MIDYTEMDRNIDSAAGLKYNTTNKNTLLVDITYSKECPKLKEWFYACNVEMLGKEWLFEYYSEQYDNNGNAGIAYILLPKKYISKLQIQQVSGMIRPIR
jgi:hypothetical protein